MDALASFTRDPLSKSASYVKLGEHLKESLAALPAPAKIGEFIDELAAAAERSHEIETELGKL